MSWVTSSVVIPPTAKIYVDDIMQAAVTRHWIIKSLAATMEAIFTVCGVPAYLTSMFDNARFPSKNGSN
jgi:hypothetical protein